MSYTHTVTVPLAWDEAVQVQVSDTPAVREIAEDADARLRKALGGLGAAKEFSN